MLHLPNDGATVSVWPTPGRSVAASAPRDDAPFAAQMSAEGQVVVWDAFRYRQYLSGDIHLHDPRPADCADRKRKREAHEEAHAQRCEKHAHAPRHYQYLPKEVLEQLQKHCEHPECHRKGKACDLCGATNV